MKIIIVGSDTEKQHFIKALGAEYCSATRINEIVLHSYNKRIGDEDITLRFLSGELRLLKNFENEYTEVDLVIYIDGPYARRSKQTVEDLIYIPRSIHIDYYNQSTDGSPLDYLTGLVNEFKKMDTCGQDQHQAQSIVASGHSVFTKREATPKNTDHIYIFKKNGNF